MSHAAIAPQNSRSTSGQHTLPSVYLVGQLPHETAASVLSAANLAGHTVHQVKGSKEACLLLTRRGVRPKGILVGLCSDEQSRFIEWLREEATMFDVPVIALVFRETEEAFLQAKQSGADDVVTVSDHEGIARRLRALNAYVADQNPPVVAGTALVAHPDHASRRQLGWVLRRAGYDLAFAGTYDELVSVARVARPALLVVAQELLPREDPQPVAEGLRSRVGLPELPLVVVTDHAWEAAHWRRVPRGAATSARCWDRLLFQVSEVTRPPMAELRATPRVFLSAFCAFRPTDKMVPTYAVTYNVSGGGLFVRTLDPPPAGSVVAIYLQLPNAAKPVVTVQAKVVWVQRPIHGSTGPTPDGFGAQILDQDSHQKDLEIYRIACQMLHAEAMSGSPSLA
jgi:CheY-like chemotaxis protein/Tfp pilus assembly protein PilZ